MNFVKRIGLALAAPLLAFVIAAAASSLILVVTDDDVAGFWDVLLTWPENRNLVNILNQTGILYLAGIACAIGFRMNLFNIGVEGQYRIGAFAAAVVAGEAWLPARPTRSWPSSSPWRPAPCGPESPECSGSPGESPR